MILGDTHEFMWKDPYTEVEYKVVLYRVERDELDYRLRACARDGCLILPFSEDLEDEDLVDNDVDYFEDLLSSWEIGVISRKTTNGKFKKISDSDLTKKLNDFLGIGFSWHEFECNDRKAVKQATMNRRA